MGARWKTETKRSRRENVKKLFRLARRRGYNTHAMISRVTSVKENTLNNWRSGRNNPSVEDTNVAIERILEAPPLRGSSAWRRRGESDSRLSTAKSKATTVSSEIDSMAAIATALEDLHVEARRRVLSWATAKFTKLEE